MAATPALNLPYCALVQRTHAKNTQSCAPASTAGPPSPASDSQQPWVGLLLGALLVGYGGPGYLRWGRPPERRRCGTLLSPGALAPGGRVCAAIGATEPITAQLGRIRAHGRFLRVVGLFCLLWGTLQMNAAGVVALKLSEVSICPQFLSNLDADSFPIAVPWPAWSL